MKHLDDLGATSLLWPFPVLHRSKAGTSPGTQERKFNILQVQFNNPVSSPMRKPEVEWGEFDILKPRGKKQNKKQNKTKPPKKPRENNKQHLTHHRIIQVGKIFKIIESNCKPSQFAWCIWVCFPSFIMIHLICTSHIFLCKQTAGRFFF